MKISVDGPNAKVIAKAILALSKFGNDLFVEADENCLQLRSLNANKSAMGTMKFNRSFFDVFNVPPGEETYCHIGMKASVGIFRNMKQVEHCEMRIIPEEAKFVLKLKCRMETMKDIVLSILDDESLTTTVSTNDMVNRIVGNHQIFNEISNNFSTVEEELTLEVLKDSVIAKNYIEGARVNDQFMRSQLKLSSREFESFRVVKEATITCCLKGLRAFLMFAEAVRGTIDLNFDKAGSPICVKIKKFNEIDCTLLMATVDPEDVSMYESDGTTVDHTNYNNNNNKERPNVSARNKETAESVRNNNNNNNGGGDETPTTNNNEEPSVSRRSNNKESNKASTKANSKEPPKSSKSNNARERSKVTKSNDNNATEDTPTTRQTRRSTRLSATNRNSESPGPSHKRKHSQGGEEEEVAAVLAKSRKSIADDTTISDAPTLFVFDRMSQASTHIDSSCSSDTIEEMRAEATSHSRRPRATLARTVPNTEDSARPPPLVRSHDPHSEVSVTFAVTTEEDSPTHGNTITDDDRIPLSPTPDAVSSINVRSIFSRCFESTYVPREPSPNSQVYVPDSDTED